MYNRDLISRPWKTSFKYIQNQEGKRALCQAMHPEFSFWKKRSPWLQPGPLGG